MRDSDNRTKSQALALYLTRLHHGNSLEFIALIFCEKLDWQDVRSYYREVEQSIMKDVVLRHLGEASTDRVSLIQEHTKDIAKELLDINDDKLALIFHSTYAYYQKVLTTRFRDYRITCIRIVLLRNHSLVAQQMVISSKFGVL